MDGYKGDLGVAKVRADLLSKGFTVLFPVTEHAPIDLVAFAAGEFHRLQVKYLVRTRGCRHREVPVCVGGPRRDAHGAWVTLRIAPSRNGQKGGVLDADAFREMGS
jgi:PD-(D/E)XK nuclease superfamily protein